ncbi:uncharacterized protein LOC107624679 [Arachis ipaensis]|uniref:uncharacterized protein LOC107624679 n=1 Tax=Arachis ipaensis TaxID=130454 RepID=UPI0007AFA36D|nr:uncharacterized protein LOC107624679 [Arachis ipaensis]
MEDTTQVMVNVVVRRSRLPNSNNTLKRDVKVTTSEVLKFLIVENWVTTIRGNRVSAVKCNKSSLTLWDAIKESTGVFLVDLDTCIQKNPRPEPNGELKKFKLGTSQKDYTDLNKVYPKDYFSLPNIDNIIDSSSGYRVLSFLNAYSGYNQIPMHKADEEKTAFITPEGIYCYTSIKKVLEKPDLAGRMMNWSVELSQFDVHYKPHSTIKA